MGRKQAVKVPKPEPVPPPREPIRVSNLYEAGALKGTLDDVAREVVIEQGYDEDVLINNVKIVLGLAAIASAAFSQFGPGKFPSNWWMVFSCVILYIVLTFLMNIYSWKMEGDAFLVTKPFRGGKGVRLSSRMARFSDEYTLLLTDRDDPNIEVASTVHISELFHEDGYLADAAWRTEVEKLCVEFDKRRSEAAAKKRD